MRSKNNEQMFFIMLTFVQKLSERIVYVYHYSLFDYIIQKKYIKYNNYIYFHFFYKLINFSQL